MLAGTLSDRVAQLAAIAGPLQHPLYQRELTSTMRSKKLVDAIWTTIFAPFSHV